jgi:hypothetical protein
MNNDNKQIIGLHNKYLTTIVTLPFFTTAPCKKIILPSQSNGTYHVFNINFWIGNGIKIQNIMVCMFKDYDRTQEDIIFEF